MSPRRTSVCMRRGGFSLVEVLIALAITSTLLTATLVALDASFRAYQSTTEEVSSNSIGRLVMHRLLTMIRTGTDFGPYPDDPRISIIKAISSNLERKQIKSLRSSGTGIPKPLPTGLRALRRWSCLMASLAHEMIWGILSSPLRSNSPMAAASTEHPST